MVTSVTFNGKMFENNYREVISEDQQQTTWGQRPHYCLIYCQPAVGDAKKVTWYKM